MYDLGPAVTGSLCKSAACGKPENPASLPTWSSGSGSLGAHRHCGGRQFLCARPWTRHSRTRVRVHFWAPGMMARFAYSRVHS